MGLVNNLSVKTEEIIDYLHSHPDFFVSHPEILTELRIPHDNIGQASSLIEYQVERLQDQIDDLLCRLDKSDSVTKRNRQFSSAVHKLVLTLQSKTTIAGFYTALSRGLRTLYHANRVLLLIFNNREPIHELPDLRFLKTDSKPAFMFTEVMHRNKPLCGSLQEEHLLTLFQDDISGIKSTVLIPVRQNNWHGLMVLGSRTPDCYSHGFELDSLLFIAGFCGQCIASCTARIK